MNCRKLREVTLELTSRCNFRCKHCYISEFNNDGLSISEIANILDSVRELGGSSIVYTGGEVLLRNDFVDIVSLTRRKGFSVNILSNGYLLSEKITKKLSELYINSFGITLFSLDNSVNDFITGAKNSSTSVINAIDLLRKYNIRVEVKTPVMIYNYSTYKDVKKYCYDNDITFIATSQITGQNNGSFGNTFLRLRPDLGYEIMRDSLPDIYAMKSEYHENDHPCKVLLDSIFIDSKGEVYPCSTFYYSFGNIKNVSLKDIWNSDIVVDLHKLKNSDLICRDCNIREYCDRCIGLAFMDGDLKGCSKFDLELALEKVKYFKGNKKEVRS